LIGRRSVFIFVFGTVFISSVGPALARDSLGTPTERLEPAIAPEASLRQIPVSNLNLTLTGVVGRNAGIALIRVEGARDKPFSVGEAIVPEVKLLAVGTSSAVISHDGALERLELNRRAGASYATSVASATSATTSDAEVQVVAQPRLFKSGLVVAFTPSEAVQNLGNNRFSVKHSFIDDQLRSGGLIDNARMQPDTRGGFRVTDIVPGSFYDSLGLQDGDTVSTINGKPPHISDLLSLHQQRDSMNTVQIQVVRDGSSRNFQLDFH
jgi:type II secretory pathway component PulC